MPTPNEDQDSKVSQYMVWSFFELSYLSPALVRDAFTKDIMSIAPEHYRCVALANYEVNNYIDTIASFQTNISADGLSDNR